MSHRPKGSDGVQITKEKWQEQWKAAGSLLQPLADTLKLRMKGLGAVGPTDFDCPNHYAKLVFEHALKQAFQEVFDMLPDTCDK